jgi:hypothetical protein
MIERSHDIEALAEAMAPYAHKTVGFEPGEWLTNEDNIALTDGEGNYNLLQHVQPGVYMGHTFYKKRGKDAVKHLREAIKVAFEQHPVHAIQGLTPLEHLGARWLARQGGFTGQGVIHTSVGPSEMFILTRTDYERLKDG